jgi:hypothetical protein
MTSLNILPSTVYYSTLNMQALLVPPKHQHLSTALHGCTYQNTLMSGKSPSKTIFCPYHIFFTVSLILPDTYFTCILLKECNYATGSLQNQTISSTNAATLLSLCFSESVLKQSWLMNNLFLHISFTTHQGTEESQI